MPDNMRNIFAGRRRRPTAPYGSRDRAETPSRGPIGGTGGYTGQPAGYTGGSRPGIGGISLPGCGGRMGCAGIVLVGLMVIIFLFLQYCGGGFDLSGLFPSNEPNSTYSGPGQLATLPPAAPLSTYYPAAGTSSPGRWLVMLYQDADDSILEKDMVFDVNEAERAGSSGGVTVVAQVDRYAGAYAGDGNWTNTRRFLLTPDNDLSVIHSQEVGNLGEANMAAGSTLVDFITWAVRTYPAEKYALILSDHGMGWPGGWSDATPKGSVDQNIPLQASLGDKLFLNELDAALSQARSQAGISKFELIGMDACLMAQLETFTMLAPHARYAVASEEVEPALGWAYASFLQSLNQNPDMDGAALGQAIVRSYIEQDLSIIDSTAQGDFLSSGSPFGGLFGSGASSGQLARERGQDASLTAVDLNKINQLNASLNHLVFLYQKVKAQNIAGSRSYAQSFTDVFGSDTQPSYLDLSNLLQIARQKINTAEINQATDAVITAIKSAVIAEKHGSKLPGANGIAIYFPNSVLYGYRSTGAESYTAIASRFASESLWDDFLAFHYTGRQFAESDAAAIIPSGAVRSPAAGGITISRISATNSTAAPGRPVVLSADISGENIGYIYLFAGYIDKQANSMLVIDKDYLESDTTRQVNGIYYPDWGQGPFRLQFEWDPVVFAISDGKTRVTALFKPQDYGRTYEEAVYTVEGLYTIAGTGQQLDARLYFVNGVLRKVVGITGAADAGSPWEITPAAGDKFTVVDTWLDLDSSGRPTGTASVQSKTLTFGSEMFTWETLDAAAGDYMVGFIVEDMDGNEQESLVNITVQ